MHLNCEAYELQYFRFVIRLVNTINCIYLRRLVCNKLESNVLDASLFQRNKTAFICEAVSSCPALQTQLK